LTDVCADANRRAGFGVTPGRDRGSPGCRAETVTPRIDPCQRPTFLEAWK
jgi:hypothetical protein